MKRSPGPAKPKSKSAAAADAAYYQSVLDQIHELGGDADMAFYYRRCKPCLTGSMQGLASIHLGTLVPGVLVKRCPLGSRCPRCYSLQRGGGAEEA